MHNIKLPNFLARKEIESILVSNLRIRFKVFIRLKPEAYFIIAIQCLSTIKKRIEVQKILCKI